MPESGRAATRFNFWAPAPVQPTRSRVSIKVERGTRLIKERVAAGLAAARRRGRKGGRPPAIAPEKVEQIIAGADGGASKASMCRTYPNRNVFPAEQARIVQLLVERGPRRTLD